MSNKINVNTWPSFAEDEITAVDNVLRSGKVNYWTGNECKLFEKEFARYIGTNYAIASANGTVSLELALYACGIGPGDEVITSPRTFIASASAIVARGAIPVLADVNLISQNITAETIQAKITKKTKAIIPVHLAGWPCDMPSIMNLAKDYGLYVIEDCAQAHGASINNIKVGAWGDFGSFSFCQDKIMTTGGEGGLLTCNNEQLYKKAWGYKEHGKDYDTVFLKQHPPGFRWLHSSFGTNMRMTEMQAAIGRVQLAKLDNWLAKRNALAEIFIQKLHYLTNIEIPLPGENIYHAYYKFYIFVKTGALGKDWSRDRVFHEINQKGIFCNVGSCSEIYMEKAFTDSPYALSECLPNAKQLGNISLMLLVHPTLTETIVNDQAEIIRSVLLEATK
ncbi:DegT/DnrJ/EryC1/StrS aminotransferase family protein [Francisellaceae bacterium]|nr:DegT/DnrJ/EryC1/StrS aminotransferase family protein [Francisellaceae bacterium]